MMMIMMMTMINSRVCGENSQCPWKTARSKALLFVKTELPLLRSAWPPAESTVTLKITHTKAWNFFCAVFLHTISDYSSHQSWCSRWVESCENSIFSRKRRTKDCFLLTHNLRNKKVSVRDKISSRCANSHKRSCSLCRTEVGGGAWRMRSVHALHFHKERTKKQCLDSKKSKILCTYALHFYKERTKKRCLDDKKVPFLTIFRRTNELLRNFQEKHF